MTDETAASQAERRKRQTTTAEQKRVMYRLLEDALEPVAMPEGEAGFFIYKAGHTDETIALAAGVAPVNVRNARVDAWGPFPPKPVADAYTEQRERIAALEARVVSLEYVLTRVANGFASLSMMRGEAWLSDLARDFNRGLGSASMVPTSTSPLPAHAHPVDLPMFGSMSRPTDGQGSFSDEQDASGRV